MFDGKVGVKSGAGAGVGESQAEGGREGKGYHPAVGWASGGAFPFIISFPHPSNPLVSDVETGLERARVTQLRRAGAGLELLVFQSQVQLLYNFAGKLDDKKGGLHWVCFLLKLCLKVIVTYSLQQAEILCRTDFPFQMGES